MDSHARHEFSSAVKETLARRVGTLCSNPACAAPVFGPSGEPEKSANTGVAAHISAAAPGGPRYDAGLSEAGRKAAGNGIWLCQRCAKLADSDPATYTTALLRMWKSQAEDRARKAQENPAIVNAGIHFASTVLVVVRQLEAPGFTPPQAPSGMVARQPLRLHPVSVPEGLSGAHIPVRWAPGVLSAGQSILTLMCQNLGTGVDQNVRVEVEFERSAVFNASAAHPGRLQLIEGGGSGASFAVFATTALLPRETQEATIIAAMNVPFEAHLWSQNSGHSPKVFIYELSFGRWEFVPRDRSPYAGQ